MDNMETGSKLHKYTLLNIILVVLALVGLAIFFSLDIFSGGKDSVFNHQGSTKLNFTGKVGRKEMSDDQMAEIVKVMEKYDEALERVELYISKQDSYAPLKQNTQVLYEIRIQLMGGARIETPMKRTTWGRLVKDVSRKVKKDLKAYATMHGGKLKTRSGALLINSM